MDLTDKACERSVKLQLAENDFSMRRMQPEWYNCETTEPEPNFLVLLAYREWNGTQCFSMAFRYIEGGKTGYQLMPDSGSTDPITPVAWALLPHFPRTEDMKDRVDSLLQK